MIKLNAFSKKNALTALVLLAAAAAVTAGTTGTEFQGFYNLMTSWTSGFLGKGIALAAFLLGAGMGVAKQTILPAVLGIVFAVVFSVGPGVITGMMSATI